VGRLLGSLLGRLGRFLRRLMSILLSLRRRPRAERCLPSTTVRTTAPHAARRHLEGV